MFRDPTSPEAENLTKLLEQYKAALQEKRFFDAENHCRKITACLNTSHINYDKDIGVHVGHKFKYIDEARKYRWLFNDAADEIIKIIIDRL